MLCVESVVSCTVSCLLKLILDFLIIKYFRSVGIQYTKGSNSNSNDVIVKSSPHC